MGKKFIAVCLAAAAMQFNWLGTRDKVMDSEIVGQGREWLASLLESNDKLPQADINCTHTEEHQRGLCETRKGLRLSNLHKMSREELNQTVIANIDAHVMAGDYSEEEGRRRKERLAADNRRESE